MGAPVIRQLEVILMAVLVTIDPEDPLHEAKVIQKFHFSRLIIPNCHGEGCPEIDFLKVDRIFKIEEYVLGMLCDDWVVSRCEV